MAAETIPYDRLMIHADRLRRAQAELARQRVDWLIVGPSADLRYLTGIPGHLSERLSVLLLPRDGDPAWLVPTLEAPLLAPLGDLVEVHRWEETQDPATLAGAIVGGGAPIVAVGDELWSAFLLRLQAALPAATWREGGRLLRPLRMVKDGREIELMRDAARRTDAAWEAFIAGRIVGLTEKQALARLLDLTHGEGLDPGFGNCGSGPASASPHHAADDRVIAPGDVVVFDWGGTLDGYFSDVTRTVVAGGPGVVPEPAFVRAYEAVLAANEAALQAVAPGVPCEAIDLAARAVLEDAGYGAYILHRVGHGLGLAVHEEPYLVLGNPLPLAPGMIFSDEPGVYLPGRWGIRIEDAVLCTDTGGERLNEATRELTVVG